MRILALDLGKNKTVGCDFEIESGNHEYMTISTTPEAIHDVIVERSPKRLVLEICSAAGWVHDLAKAFEIEVQVANPTHEGWRWRSIKRKNDRLDALKLAKLSAMNQLPLVHMPANDNRQWRSFIQYRDHLMKRRTRIKNHIRAVLDRQGLTMPPGKQGWTVASIDALRQVAQAPAEVKKNELWRAELWLELQAFESADELIRQVHTVLNNLGVMTPQVQRLQGIPGVGPRLAEAVVAVIDDPRRFKRGKQVASYVGLTPRQYQSGSMDRQGGISGQGHRLLRSLLIEVSWLGLQHNAWMREVYKRTLRGTPSRKKIAIVAVARRLLIRCWAMLRDESCWSCPIKEAA